MRVSVYPKLSGLRSFCSEELGCLLLKGPCCSGLQQEAKDRVARTSRLQRHSQAVVVVGAAEAPAISCQGDRQSR